MSPKTVTYVPKQNRGEGATQIYNSIFSHLLRHYCKRAYGFDFALQEPANNVLLSFCCQFN